MDLNKLSKEAFETAKAHGWHDEELPDETYLMLIITEIAEAVQADRKDKHAYKDKFLASLMPDDDGDMFSMLFEQYIKNSVEDELSDIIIRCLDLIALRGKGVYADEYMAKYLHDFLKREPSFPEVAYELCKFAVSTDESLGLSERIGGIISLVTSYCKQKDIDIDFFVDIKMRYNRLRPFKHGNKKY